MENKDTLPNGYGEIVKAVNAVMTEVSFIEKDKTIGEGKNSYKGVSDEGVKKLIGAAMAKHGLAIFQVGIKATPNIHRFTDNNGYQKTSVFTEVVTKYRLCHISGEYVDLEGYGHGVDSQDKSAGKATTYALKYLLLYTFLVSTGKIDDADAVHSDEITKSVTVKVDKAPTKPNATKEIVENYCAAILNGEIGMYEEVFEKYVVGTGGKKLLDEAKAKYKQLSGELSWATSNYPTSNYKTRNMIPV